MVSRLDGQCSSEGYSGLPWYLGLRILEPASYRMPANGYLDEVGIWSRALTSTEIFRCIVAVRIV